MELFNYLLNYFGIDLLNDTATLTDLISVCFIVFGALFIFTFTIRSLFLLLRFGER